MFIQECQWDMEEDISLQSKIILSELLIYPNLTYMAQPKMPPACLSSSVLHLSIITAIPNSKYLRKS